MFVPLRVMSWKLPPPDRPVEASYRLVCSLTSSSISGAGEMLSVIEPSFDVMLVASMPLKNRLVLVVRVPFTDGEMLPVPLMSTGGRSALTPASAESRWVKLRVEVGTCVSSSAFEPPVGRGRVGDDHWRVAAHGHLLGHRADFQRHVELARDDGLDQHVAARSFLKPSSSNDSS